MATTIEELLSDTRRILQDPDGNFWTDDELRDYINEGQEEYVRETKFLRERFPITMIENQSVYTLPIDTLEIDRIERTDNHEVVPVTSFWLEQQFGGDWKSTTGEPTHYYSDLDGENKFRFYPRPEPSIETSGTIISPSVLQDVDLVFDATTANYPGMFYDEDVLYLADTTGLFIFDENLSQVEFIPYSFSLVSGEPFSISVAPGVVSVTTQGADPGTIFVAHGLEIKKITPARVVSSFGTSAENVKILFPFSNSKGFSTKMFYSSATTTYSTTLLSFSEATVFSDDSFQSDYSISLDKQFFCQGTDGVHMTTLTGTSPTQLTTNTVFGLTVLNDTTVFINDGNTLSTIDTSGTITATTVTTLRTGAGLYSERNNIWAMNTSDFLVRIISGVITETWETDIFIGEPPGRYLTTQSPIKNKFLYLERTTNAIKREVLRITDIDLGAIIDSDTDTFICEVGAVKDITDPDDIIFFEGEEGVIVQILEADEQGTLFYVRKPKIDLIEVLDPQGLTYYAAFRAYEKDDDRINLNKSAYWESRFRRVVNREKGKGLKGYNKDRVPIRTYYF